MTVDQRTLMRARDAFATHDSIDPAVRPSVVKAWTRCKAAGVPSKGAFKQTISSDYDRESLLIRSVSPVTEQFLQQVGETDVAMMLIDRDARIVGRWIGGDLLEPILDRAGSNPSCVFDETTVGSTALGSVLEVRKPVVIEGAEHWNESFDQITAVGAPIIHPATGVVEGVIDVVCQVGAPVGLMLPMVHLAAREASERLLTGYAREDRELLDAFLQGERRGPRRPVVALNERMTLTNKRADSLLRNRPGMLAWADIEAALSRGQTKLVVADSSSPGPIVGRIREIRTESGQRAAVVQFSEGDDFIRRPPRANNKPSPTSSLQAPRDPVALRQAVQKRAVGSAMLWDAAIESAARACGPGGRLLLTGPGGCGKSHLATALAEAFGDCQRLDVATMTQSLDVTTDVIVIDDPSLQELRAQRRLAEWLPKLEIMAPQTMVIATLTGDCRNSPQLVTAFDDVVELPALAARVTDIDALIDAWAASHGTLRVDAAARRSLALRSWPGNVSQLYRTLTTAAQRSDGHMIHADDLPAGANTAAPARKLTYLENVERSAIGALIAAADGNKKRVASELGISRATLYRKMAALGLGT